MVQFLVGARYFSHLPSVHTSSTAHSACYSMGTTGNCTVVQWPRPEAEHSPPSSTKIKNDMSYLSRSHVFMACIGTTVPLSFTLYIFFASNQYLSLLIMPRFLLPFISLRKSNTFITSNVLLCAHMDNTTGKLTSE